MGDAAQEREGEDGQESAAWHYALGPGSPAGEQV